MGRIIQKIKAWYRGAYVPPPENDPNSSIIFVSPGHHEQSTSAKVAKTLVQFWVKNWHILFPLVVMASVALFIHFDSNTNAASETKQSENHQITNTNHNASKQ